MICVNRIIWLVCLSIPFLSTALLKAEDAKSLFSAANKYYRNKQYDEAEKMYLLVLKQDKKNVHALYNLGNTYYHLKQYPDAVLYYERAKKWLPDDKAINQNIQLTNNKLFSKIEFSKEFFVTKWVKGSVYEKSASSWSIWMLICLWTGVLLLCLYFYSTNTRYLRMGIFILGISILLAFYTRLAYNREQKKEFAVVMKQNAFIKKAPVESMNEADSIRPGIKVQIIDTDKNWFKIKQPNGKEGWIDNKSIELI